MFMMLMIKRLCRCAPHEEQAGQVGRVGGRVVLADMPVVAEGEEGEERFVEEAGKEVVLVLVVVGGAVLEHHLHACCLSRADRV